MTTSRVPRPTSTLSTEGEVGAASTSKQAAVVAVDGERLDTQFSGKAGLGIPVSDALSAYGEVFIPTTEDDDDSVWACGSEVQLLEL